MERKQYKAIIIDDEPKLREVLFIKLQQYCPNIHIVDKAGSASEGYDSIIRNQPEIVFLDISMPGESGFDMLSRFSTVNFSIIFVTGFSKYGIDALKVNAVDYLLKPVNTSDLIVAVNKAIERIEKQQRLEKYENLLFSLNNPGDQEAKLTIPNNQEYKFVKINEIIRCEGWQKYTKFHLKDSNPIVSSYNLGYYREMLLKYKFYGTHKSHLINTVHISSYLKEGIVVMNNGDEIPVSRRKREEFVNLFIKT